MLSSVGRFVAMEGNLSYLATMATQEMVMDAHLLAK
jgi:hypothetical protein